MFAIQRTDSASAQPTTGPDNVTGAGMDSSRIQIAQVRI